MAFREEITALSVMRDEGGGKMKQFSCGRQTASVLVALWKTKWMGSCPPIRMTRCAPSMPGSFSALAALLLACVPTRCRGMKPCGVQRVRDRWPPEPHRRGALPGSRPVLAFSCPPAPPQSSRPADSTGGRPPLCPAMEASAFAKPPVIPHPFPPPLGAAA